jgi:uncharacterized membrane protein YfcA
VVRNPHIGAAVHCRWWVRNSHDDLPLEMQYKNAMQRLLKIDKVDTASDGAQTPHPKIDPLEMDTESDEEKGESQKPTSVELPVWVEVVVENSSFILNYLVPLAWCFLFVLIMDRESFVSTLYMPFLGIFAATLANTVPIGGGIVYVPALLLLGVDLKLGVSFTVATMSFGNGLFGFLRWLNKNPGLIGWESFWYTVLPSWLGSLVGIFLLPEMKAEYVKILFASVCVKVSILVALAAWKGGMDKLSFIFSSSSSASSNNSVPLSVPSAVSSSSAPPLPSSCIITLIIITFLGGVFLVPNIGIGPALTTYLILNSFGFSTHSSVVTGIITGGWVCVLPFLIHVFYLRDVPYELWLMVIPGVYLGAMVRTILFLSSSFFI